MALTGSKRSIMTLYSGATDPYSHRVRIVLAEKGVAHEVIDTDSSSKAVEELNQLNPYGTRPVLLDRELALFESKIIMEYLDERFPHPPLLPVYPVAKARSRLMIFKINKDWYSLAEQISSSMGDHDKLNMLRQGLANRIMSMLPVFKETPFCLSEEFSLVDCCVAPLLWRLPKLGVVFSSPVKAIEEYEKRVFSRESFKSSLTEQEKQMR